MKSDMRKWALGLAAAVAPLVMAGTAGAYTIQPNASEEGPVAGSTTGTGGSSVTTWAYEADLTQTGEAMKGDGFIISNVVGFDGFYNAAGTKGVTSTSFNTAGYDVSAVAATSAGVTTLTFAYTDAATVAGPKIPFVSIEFYDFANSAIVGLGDWVSHDHALSTGAAESSPLAVDLPDPSDLHMTPLPTPAIAGTGLFGLLGVAALRRRAKVAAC